jgi:hypothetical protein
MESIINEETEIKVKLLKLYAEWRRLWEIDKKKANLLDPEIQFLENKLKKMK